MSYAVQTHDDMHYEILLDGRVVAIVYSLEEAQQFINDATGETYEQ